MLFLVFVLREKSHQNFISVLAPFAMLLFFRLESICGMLNNMVLVVAMEKAMAPHSSIPAWTIPWTEEPGGLQSMGSQRVGHD